MLVNGRPFEGTVDYTSTDIRLRVCTGRKNTSCISQFVPSVFPNAQIIYKLLLALHSHRLCCFLTSTFALYVAGRLNSYDGMTISITMTDFKVTPILKWLFQKYLTPTFALDHEFMFTLTNADDASLDLFLYAVSCDDITMPISILGFDTDTLCGPLSNVDLVYFVWDNFIRFSYKRYATDVTP